MTDSYPAVDPFQVPAPVTRTLQALEFGFDQALADMPQARATLRVIPSRDPVAERTILRIRTSVLAEQLPDERLHGDLTVPRWASPWQHLKDRWRDRWWFAWAVRRWPVRHVDEHHHVTVPVRAWWMYPHSPHTLMPGQGYGVLRTETSEARWGYGPRSDTW